LAHNEEQKEKFTQVKQKFLNKSNELFEVFANKYLTVINLHSEDLLECQKEQKQYSEELTNCLVTYSLTEKEAEISKLGGKISELENKLGKTKNELAESQKLNKNLREEIEEGLFRNPPPKKPELKIIVDKELEKIESTFKELDNIPNTSIETIKKNKKRLSLQYSPDKYRQNPANHPASSIEEANEMMKTINSVYDVLIARNSLNNSLSNLKSPTAIISAAQEAQSRVVAELENTVAQLNEFRAEREKEIENKNQQLREMELSYSSLES